MAPHAEGNNVFESSVGTTAHSTTSSKPELFTVQSPNVKYTDSDITSKYAYRTTEVNVTDGKYVQQVPSKQLKEKKVNGERLLVGNNGAEGAFFVPRTINTEEDLKNWLGTLLPLMTQDDINKVLLNYPVDLNVTENYATNGLDMPDATSISPVAHGQQARADVSNLPPLSHLIF